MTNSAIRELCPQCGKRIFSRIGSSLMPMNNYTNGFIVFKKTSGAKKFETKLKFPMCIDCADNFNLSSTYNSVIKYYQAAKDLETAGFVNSYFEKVKGLKFNIKSGDKIKDQK